MRKGAPSGLDFLRRRTVKTVNILVGDILEMKKQHPCGEKRFSVLRVGIDFKLRCLKCGHEVMVPRVKAEKNIKKVIRDDKNTVTEQ